jgi:hypothetical protein
MRLREPYDLVRSQSKTDDCQRIQDAATVTDHEPHNALPFALVVAQPETDGCQRVQDETAVTDDDLHGDTLL